MLDTADGEKVVSVERISEPGGENGDEGEDSPEGPAATE